MTDRNETKKFLYDTELSTPHKVLGDNYDEQLRATLNYAPKLVVRKIKGFNECPVPEPSEPKTYSYTIDGGSESYGDGFYIPARGTANLTRLGFPYTDSALYDFEKEYAGAWIPIPVSSVYELSSSDVARLKVRVIRKSTKEIIAYLELTLEYSTV